MRRKHQLFQEAGPKTPGYIVTFSDMVTLLLTFFVMLLSLAQVQDDEIFHKGQDSFVRSLEFFGLGVFWGRKSKPDLGNVKVKYFINKPDEFFRERTIDSREQEIRKIFKRVVKSAKAMPSQIVARGANFSVTDIRFFPGAAILNESAQEYLMQFALDLQQSANSRTMKLYVLGLARDVKSEKERWILSAKRAQVVSDFLERELNSGSRLAGMLGVSSGWSVYSWGAGQGGDWTGQESLASEGSQILIAVLRTGS